MAEGPSSILLERAGFEPSFRSFGVLAPDEDAGLFGPLPRLAGRLTFALRPLSDLVDGEAGAGGEITSLLRDDIGGDGDLEDGRENFFADAAREVGLFIHQLEIILQSFLFFEHF